jgi:hypothetical protein
MIGTDGTLRRMHAAHPYQALGAAGRPEWTLALPFEALHLTAGYPAPAGGSWPWGTNSSEAELRQ